MSSKVNIDECYGIQRQSGESDHRWRFRSCFIAANRDAYSTAMGQLTAYSMAWCNWKLSRNMYNPKLQAILEECHGRLPQHVAEEIDRLQNAVADEPKIQCVRTVPGKLHESAEEESVKGFHAEAYMYPEKSSKSNKKKSNKKDMEKQDGKLQPISFRPASDKELTMQPLSNSQSGTLADSHSKRGCSSNQNTLSNGFHGGNQGHNKFHGNNFFSNTNYNSYQKLDENNIGRGLLFKMGWKGVGGVGRNEDGIEEPVFVDQIKGRKGLGHQVEQRTKGKFDKQKTHKLFQGSPQFVPEKTHGKVDKQKTHELFEESPQFIPEKTHSKVDKGRDSLLPTQGHVSNHGGRAYDLGYDFQYTNPDHVRGIDGSIDRRGLGHVAQPETMESKGVECSTGAGTVNKELVQALDAMRLHIEKISSKAKAGNVRKGIAPGKKVESIPKNDLLHTENAPKIRFVKGGYNTDPHHDVSSTTKDSNDVSSTKDSNDVSSTKDSNEDITHKMNALEIRFGKGEMNTKTKKVDGETTTRKVNVNESAKAFNMVNGVALKEPIKERGPPNVVDSVRGDEEAAETYDTSKNDLINIYNAMKVRFAKGSPDKGNTVEPVNESVDVQDEQSMKITFQKGAVTTDRESMISNGDKHANHDLPSRSTMITSDALVTEPRNPIKQHINTTPQVCPPKVSKTNPFSAIGANNVGHAMLLKMGWKGSGGMGRNEDGIAEPIVPNAVKGRQGLGHEPVVDDDVDEDINFNSGWKKQKKLTRNRQNESSMSTAPTVPGLVLHLPHRGAESEEDPLLILRYSCSTLGAALGFQKEHVVKADEDTAVHQVQMVINKVPIATGYGATATEARDSAAERGVNFLMRTQPVLYENDHVLHSVNNAAIPVHSEVRSEQLVPGLVLRLPYHGESDWTNFLNARNIMEESCNISHCKIELRKMNSSESKHSYAFFIDGVYISKGADGTDKRAANKAYRAALGALQNRQPVAYTCDTKYPQVKNKTIPGLTLHLISDEDRCRESDIKLLRGSCSRYGISYCLIKYMKGDQDTSMASSVRPGNLEELPKVLPKVLWHVKLVIGDAEVANCFGSSVPQAHHRAAVAATQLLIMNKQAVVYESKVKIDLSPQHLNLKVVQFVGNKLKFNRDDHDLYDTGLTTSAGSAVKSKQGIKGVQLQNLFEEFLDSEEEQIRFSCGFDNAERALVHRIANNWDLKHVSYGSGEGRYIVISKRW